MRTIDTEKRILCTFTPAKKISCGGAGSGFPMRAAHYITFTPVGKKGKELHISIKLFFLIKSPLQDWKSTTIDAAMDDNLAISRQKRNFETNRKIDMVLFKQSISIKDLSTVTTGNILPQLLKEHRQTGHSGPFDTNKEILRQRNLLEIKKTL